MAASLKPKLWMRYRIMRASIAIFLVLAFLKLAGIGTMSWALVTAPIWVPVVAFITVVLITAPYVGGW